MSTGIGTENIDIVMNELDALVNIDLDKKNSKRTYCFTIVQIRNLWKCKS
jgi:uridine phosphorylase